MIEFEVVGVPRPKGSLRHVGRGRLVEQTDVKKWMKEVRDQAPRLPALVGPVEAVLAFTFERPRSAKNRLYPYVRSTGDLDKLVRGVLDAIQPYELWPGLIMDDSQVVRITASKDYGDTPGVSVTLKEIG